MAKKKQWVLRFACYFLLSVTYGMFVVAGPLSQSDAGFLRFRAPLDFADRILDPILGFKEPVFLYNMQHLMWGVWFLFASGMLIAVVVIDRVVPDERIMGAAVLTMSAAAPLISSALDLMRPKLLSWTDYSETSLAAIVAIIYVIRRPPRYRLLAVVLALGHFVFWCSLARLGNGWWVSPIYGVTTLCPISAAMLWLWGFSAHQGDKAPGGD